MRWQNEKNITALEREAEQAEQEIVEAKRKILHASDTLQRIYKGYYADF